MNGKTITVERVGADVEVFLVDAEKKPVPCVGIVGGTKEKPRALSIGEGYAIQEDNVMLEYNIPAAKDVFSFVYSVMRVQEAITEEVKQYGLSPIVVPSMKFDPEQLKSKQAKAVGCAPDYCVWERKENEKVKLDETIRGAGAHVHISFKVGNEVPKMPQYLSEIERFVMALDIAVGVPSVLIDKDRVRRQFYGKAGAFRPREYGATAAGLEYRVPSNFWTADPTLVAWMYQQVQVAAHQCNYYGPGYAEKLKPYRDNILKAINEGDEKAAQQICGHWQISLPGNTPQPRHRPSPGSW